MVVQRLLEMTIVTCGRPCVRGLERVRARVLEQERTAYVLLTNRSHVVSLPCEQPTSSLALPHVIDTKRRLSGAACGQAHKRLRGLPRLLLSSYRVAW